MSSEPPVYTYLSGRGVGGNAVGRNRTRADPRSLRWRTRCSPCLPGSCSSCGLVIWAVVGALFWIPLVLRAVFRFSISLIEAMFEGQKPVYGSQDPPGRGELLPAGVRCRRRGRDQRTDRRSRRRDRLPRTACCLSSSGPFWSGISSSSSSGGFKPHLWICGIGSCRSLGVTFPRSPRAA